MQLERQGDTLLLSAPPRASARWGIFADRRAHWFHGPVCLRERSRLVPRCCSRDHHRVGLFGIRAAHTRHQLRLRRDGSGTLERWLDGRGRGIPLRAGQVQVRIGERGIGADGRSRVAFLAVDHGTDTYEMLVGASHPELAWAVAEIERWLAP